MEEEIEQIITRNWKKIFYQIVTPLAVVLVVLISYFFTQSTHGANFCSKHGKLGEQRFDSPAIYQPCSFWGVPFAEQLAGFGNKK